MAILAVAGVPRMWRNSHDRGLRFPTEVGVKHLPVTFMLPA